MRVGVDRGGTFTDAVAVDLETGAIRTAKVLSGPGSIAAAVREALGLAPEAPWPPLEVRVGTTVATNALLEGRGARTAFVVTRGLGDLLRIGTQARADLFALRIEKPPPLHDEVAEIDARLDVHGRPLCVPQPDALERLVAELREAGVEAAAVVVVHGTRDGGALERRVADALRRGGLPVVVASHEAAPVPGLLARARTAVVDARLSALLGAFVEDLQSDFANCELRLMQSSGALVHPGEARPSRLLLSGPAGGATALGWIAAQAGAACAIGIDMGGTSTDVCRWSASEGVALEPETRVGAVHVRAPAVAVHSIAAGGGSLCRVQDGRLRVGPESAGAEPGPIAYGRGGREPTLTDASLVLGRLSPARFAMPLDVEAARARLAEMGATLGWSAERLAEGFVRIACESMAGAIRRVSVERGHDVREHVLVAFGGAAGQYACAVARRLGIRTVIAHPLAGVLSAAGIALAPIGTYLEADAGGIVPGPEAAIHLQSAWERLEQRARAQTKRLVHSTDTVGVRRLVRLRAAGSETVVEIDASEPDWRAAYEREHRRRFGFVHAGRELQVASVAVAVSASSRWPHALRLAADGPRGERRPHRMYVDGRWQPTQAIDREALHEGEGIEGPVLLLEASSTFVVEPGFEARLDSGGLLVVTDRRPRMRERAQAARDPERLELFDHAFADIAEEMGAALRRSAVSTNVRDRQDFSCALFDADGRLVANAPHIPVHLGAMGASVRAVRAAHPHPEPGDAFATNDPAAGGSHLPDVTVVVPVHGANGRVAFHVASRAHHAEIGGRTPGSMPADSRRLEEEGVVLRAERIVCAGRYDRRAVRALFERGPWPSRRPDDNVADLEAQLAACRTGVRRLGELARRFGAPAVQAYMRHVQQAAAEAVRAVVARWPEGRREASDVLDDGSVLRVALERHGARWRIDFTGSAPPHPGNLNAPPAVVRACVLYVLRCLVGRSLALNDGCLDPIELVVPAPSILAPPPDAAVAAGNVETSQRIVDVLLAALGLCAASQGTMNNLSFGDATFGYYETLGGGAGAGAGFDGASAVHVHMTNSLLTDVEVLEARHPVRVRALSIRRGSGGAGRWRGGDGMVREIEALVPLDVAIVSERRRFGPPGAAGGAPGMPGRNVVAGVEVGPRFVGRIEPGQTIRIETPGGGGWGAPEPG
ncbi:MAG: hydantoinase B/oxoprolinase family protein [Myxococcales bacterium]|nr:hydantoinase B/oxoprolinase family protein [Myxococcales bacterium]